MRNMSFMLTTEQVKNKTKTVTRRLGWKFLKPGDKVMAVEKCRGLQKGEKVKKICPIRIIKVRPEPLHHIYLYNDDVSKEGFPEMSAKEFIKMFCETHQEVGYGTVITRIEFEYI